MKKKIEIRFWDKREPLLIIADSKEVKNMMDNKKTLGIKHILYTEEKIYIDIKNPFK